MASSGTTSSSDTAIAMSTTAGSLADQDLKEAQTQLDRLLSNDFFRTKVPRELPTFDASEIGTGPQLGIGGFGVVSEVECIQLRNNNSKVTELEQAAEKSVAWKRRTTDATAHSSMSNISTLDASTKEEVLDACEEKKQDVDDAHEEVLEEEDKYLTELGLDVVGRGQRQDANNFHNSLASLPTNPDNARVYMAENTLRNGHARYAIKCLKPGLSEKDKKYAVMDMAIEAKFLAVISHPNIVKMRGTACTGSLRNDYFIVMDRLYGTLDERIDDWTEQEKMMGGSCCGLWGVDKKRLTEVRLERITALYDVTKAMEYLHENNIIYRDIKPENLGFDIR